MLVYDITNPKSFEQLDSWREEFLHQVHVEEQRGRRILPQGLPYSKSVKLSLIRAYDVFLYFGWLELRNSDAEVRVSTLDFGQLVFFNNFL